MTQRVHRMLKELEQENLEWFDRVDNAVAEILDDMDNQEKDKLVG